MATKSEYIAEERLRIMAILQSPEGLSHPKTAINFALNSGMTPELANATMRELPVESAFLTAMDREGAIGVNPGAAANAGGIFADDPKAKRMAELAAGGEQYNVQRGYRQPKAAS